MDARHTLVSPVGAFIRFDLVVCQPAQLGMVDGLRSTPAMRLAPAFNRR
jgi:hypothetical protein